MNAVERWEGNLIMLDDHTQGKGLKPSMDSIEYASHFDARQIMKD